MNVCTRVHAERFALFAAVCLAGILALQPHERATVAHVTPLPEDTSVFSPDGTRILTSYLVWKPRVWDAKTGALLFELDGHTGIVTDGAWSPDGTRIATAASDENAKTNDVKLWDAATGRMIFDLDVADSTYSLQFSSDGTQLLAFLWNSSVRVWDTRTGKPQLTLENVIDVAYSPDSTQLATSAYSGNVSTVRDARTGRTRYQLRGGHVKYSPDGLQILTATRDHVTLWNARTGKPEHELTCKDSGLATVFSRDSSRVLTDCAKDTPAVWNTRTGEHVVDLDGHLALVRAAAFSPDGSLIVTGGHDGNALVWDAQTGELIVDLAHRHFVTNVAFSPDSTKVATGSTDSTAVLWDARTGHELVVAKHANFLGTAEVSPDGTRFASVGLDGTTQLWNVDTKDRIALLEDHAKRRHAVISPDGSQLVVAGASTVPEVYDVATGTLRFPLIGHRHNVRHVSMSPDGGQIATAATDGRVMLWDAASGRRQATTDYFRCHADTVEYSRDGLLLLTNGRYYGPCIWQPTTNGNSPVYDYLVNDTVSARISPDGSRVATAQSSGQANVWLTEHDWRSKRIRHAGVVDVIEFSPDGTRVVTASRDHTAKLTSVASGRSIALTGHRAEVNDAVFSDDGAWVITTSRDRTAKLWDGTSGSLRATFTTKQDLRHARMTRGGLVLAWGWDRNVTAWTQQGRLAFTLAHADLVADVARSPDGSRIATASWDGRAQIWDAKTGALVHVLAGDDRLFEIIYSADGTRLVTIGATTVTVWDASTGARLVRVD